LPIGCSLAARDPLKAHAEILDAGHLREQIRRMEAAVETNPSLPIGTAISLSYSATSSTTNIAVR
jgi:hypothetical protein